ERDARWPAPRGGLPCPQPHGVPDIPSPAARRWRRARREQARSATSNRCAAPAAKPYVNAEAGPVQAAPGCSIDRAARRLGTTALAGIAVFVIAAVALQWLRTDLDWLRA